MCAYAPYDIENVHVIGYDVVSNRPKVAAYRAPGAPISEYAVESVVDEIAKKLDIDHHRPAHAERGPRRHQGGVRPEVWTHRARGDAQRHQEDRALECAAAEVAGPRRGLGLLVQYRRRRPAFPSP